MASHGGGGSGGARPRDPDGLLRLVHLAPPRVGVMMRPAGDATIRLRAARRTAMASLAPTSPATPPSRSPSVDSEVDVMPSVRRAAVVWGQSISRHWDSGAPGRSIRPALRLDSADHMAAEVRRQRAHRSEASSVHHSPDFSASEPMADANDTRDFADSEECQNGYADGAASSSQAAASSSQAGARPPPLSPRPLATTSRSAIAGEGQGQGRQVQGQGQGQGQGQRGGGADASSDSPVLMPAASWQARKRPRKSKIMHRAARDSHGTSVALARRSVKRTRAMVSGTCACAARHA